MNHLYSNPEIMFGMVMFGLLSMVALTALALAVYSQGEDDGHL